MYAQVSLVPDQQVRLSPPNNLQSVEQTAPAILLPLMVDLKNVDNAPVLSLMDKVNIFFSYVFEI